MSFAKSAKATPTYFRARTAALGAPVARCSDMAEWHYCWRCRTRVPMLTEAEWAQVQPLLSQAIDDVKRYRETMGVSLKEAVSVELDRSARAKYLELTGYEETM